MAHVQEHREVFQRLFDLLEASRTAPLGAAFRFAEECREIATDYAKSTGGARAANTRIIEAVATWVAWAHPESPARLRAAAEAHRRVQGNAQAAIVFEDLFLDLLYHG